MNLLLLYFILAKATLTSFSGMTSLPILRDDLVERHHMLTDRQLNTAVAVGRISPGPNGLFVVSAGYMIAGIPGAIVGWAAMITPAFLIIPMLRYLARRADSPAVRSAIHAVISAAAGLTAASTIPMARDALTGWGTLSITIVALAVLVLSELDTVWILLGSAAAGLIFKLLIIPL
jgi:chromate transporter